MANEQPPAANVETADAPATKPRKKGLVVVVALGGALLGAGTGAFLLAPRLIPSEASAATTAGGGAHEAESTEPGRVFQIDNLIVNPAGSEGTRFLMISVAYEVANEEHDRALREHEVRLRDEIISILERQTLTSLMLPGARQQLKAALADAVRPLLPPAAAVTVYLPQYVLQ